jgi:hypothetical protein
VAAKAAASAAALVKVAQMAAAAMKAVMWAAV